MFKEIMRANAGWNSKVNVATAIVEQVLYDDKYTELTRKSASVGIKLYLK